MLSQKELIIRLSYNKKTGVFIWKKKDVLIIQDKTWNKNHANNEAGYLRAKGYRVINIGGKEYQCGRLAWLFVYGKMPVNEIDHINGVSSDNRISNLREATRSENAINRGIQSNNKSGFKGIYKRLNLNSWVASIMKNGKKITIGSFPSAKEASEAYLIAAKKIHGEFRRHE